MEPKGKAMMEGVRMAMGTLDCSICDKPLVPPIYQCGMGHLLCRLCRFRILVCPSPLCASPMTDFTRCLSMERIVESIEVPCCFAKNGCTQKMACFKRLKHEKACQHGPCFCPVPRCSFTGPSAALRDHFTGGRHKWPSMVFEYYVQFDLRLHPGPHVLHAKDGSSVFLVNVVPAPAEPLGHAISLVCVQPEARDSPFGCSVVFSCFTGHHQISTLDAVRYSTLADGLPKDTFCVVPKASGGAPVVLKTTIDAELVFDLDDELEDEDDEGESYDEDDDDSDDKDDSDDQEEDSDDQEED